MRTGPQQNSAKMSVIPRQSWLANERPDILKYNHFRRYILLQLCLSVREAVFGTDDDLDVALQPPCSWEIVTSGRGDGFGGSSSG